MLELHTSDIHACARCGDCRESVKLESAHKGVYHVCPIKDQRGFDSYTARGKLMVLRTIVEGKDIDEDQHVQHGQKGVCLMGKKNWASFHLKRDNTIPEIVWKRFIKYFSPTLLRRTLFQTDENHLSVRLKSERFPNIRNEDMD